MKKTSMENTNNSFDIKKIGWRQFIRERISSKLMKCLSFTTNASNTLKKDPLHYICKIIIAHYILAWSRYASDRHEKERNRTAEIKILQDLLTEIKRYHSPPHYTENVCDRPWNRPRNPATTTEWQNLPPKTTHKTRKIELLATPE